MLVLLRYLIVWLIDVVLYFLPIQNEVFCLGILCILLNRSFYFPLLFFLALDFVFGFALKISSGVFPFIKASKISTTSQDSFFIYFFSRSRKFFANSRKPFI